MPTEPTRCSNTAVPSYSVLDTRVDPDQIAAAIRVRRDGPTNYSFYMEWHIEVAGPVAGWTPYEGGFVFDFDVAEIVIPVTMPRPLREGESVRVVLSHLAVFNVSPMLTRQIGRIALDADAAPALSPGALSRPYDRPVTRKVDAAWPRDFYSNLIDSFTCTRTGKDAAGRPCFKNALAHGRAQFSNGEVGLYSDPASDGTNPLQTHAGKRLLVPEKLPRPITAEAGNQSKVTTYSTPLVSTEENARLGYGRFEYRFALLSPQQGMWPAGWSLCLPHWRWPDCEQDTVEISFNKADPAQVMPYTTNWWRNEVGKPQSEGQFAILPRLLPGFDYAQAHSYWSEWTPERLAWGIDEMLVFSVPNRFFLKNRTDKDDPNRLYMMLQIALGGAGGDCARGCYPLAPSTYAPGAPAMVVDHIAHWAAPLV